MTQRLSLAEGQHIAFRLAQAHLAFDEPIPDFATRFPGILESCLKTPFQTFSGKALYGSLVAKASILFYLLVKNHPFQNGNKRIAVATLLIFLLKNGKWLDVDLDTFHRFTLWVAAGEARQKDLFVLGIEGFVRKHLAPARE